jgi:hypothetical protein
MAKPLGDHIPPGGFVSPKWPRFSDARKINWFAWVHDISSILPPKGRDRFDDPRAAWMQPNKTGAIPWDGAAYAMAKTLGSSDCPRRQA